MNKSAMHRFQAGGIAAAASLALLAGCGGSDSEPPTPSLRFIGQSTVEPLLQFQGTRVGGFSGIDYDAQNDLFYLISDDRSDNNPARFYTAKIALTPSSIGTPQLQGTTPFKKADGNVFGNRTADPGNVPDPESIRFLPGLRTLLWSSEGDKALNLDPFVRETRLDGSFVRELPKLDMFRIKAGQAGPRNNLTFEGLAVSPNGQSYWASMETALFEDGVQPTAAAAGGPLRITQFDLATGRALRQFAYVPDAIPKTPVPATAAADNGVSEILMLDDNRMLVLERAFSTGHGNSLRVYLVDVREASNTLAQLPLTPGSFTPATKKLVINFDSLQLPQLDNTEGMTLGPRLPNGNRTLIFVSDDNFRGFLPNQISQFLAFEILEDGR